MIPLTWTMPIKLVNFSNRRLHWAKKASLTKQLRTIARHWCCLNVPHAERTLPAKVTLTRIYTGRSKEMDGDGCVRAFKPIRDGIADSFGMDDKEKNGWQWECKQERGTADEVRVEIYLSPPDLMSSPGAEKRRAAV